MTTKQIGNLLLTESSNGNWDVSSADTGVKFAEICKSLDSPECFLRFDDKKRWPCTSGLVPLSLMDNLTKALAWVECLAALDEMVRLDQETGLYD